MIILLLRALFKEAKIMIKVCKFGGTSLADSSQYKKVKSIIDKDSSRRVIVVSAPGKRNKSDYKITDLLYLTESHIKYHVDYNTIFNQSKERFYEIKNSLNLDIDLDKEFEKQDREEFIDYNMTDEPPRWFDKKKGKKRS